MGIGLIMRSMNRSACGVSGSRRDCKHLGVCRCRRRVGMGREVIRDKRLREYHQLLLDADFCGCKRTYDNLIDFFIGSGAGHPHIQSFTSTLSANLAFRQPRSDSHLFWRNRVGVHSRGSLRDHLGSGASNRDPWCDAGVNLRILG